MKAVFLGLVFSFSYSLLSFGEGNRPLLLPVGNGVLVSPDRVNFSYYSDDPQQSFRPDSSNNPRTINRYDFKARFEITYPISSLNNLKIVSFVNEIKVGEDTYELASTFNEVLKVTSDKFQGTGDTATTMRVTVTQAFDAVFFMTSRTTRTEYLRVPAGATVPTPSEEVETYFYTAGVLSKSVRTVKGVGGAADVVLTNLYKSPSPLFAIRSLTDSRRPGKTIETDVQFIDSTGKVTKSVFSKPDSNGRDQATTTKYSYASTPVTPLNPKGIYVGYTQITNPFGQTSTISYNSFGQITFQVDTDGNIFQNDYDAYGRLVKGLVNNVVKFVATYNSIAPGSEPTSQTRYGEGSEKQVVSFDGTTRTITVTAFSGAVSTRKEKADGSPISEQRPDGTSVTYGAKTADGKIPVTLRGVNGTVFSF